MASQDFLNKAYLAYFGRPVDPVGAYAFKDSTEIEVYEAFFASPESQRLYGAEFGAEQINSIYQMHFGRDAEPAGLAHWLGMVETGRLTPAGAALAILQGAQGSDKVIIDNKLAASAKFTAALDTLVEADAYVGDAAAQYAREFLQSVGSQPKTQVQVDAAVATLVEIAEAGVIGKPNLFTLTENAIITEDVLADFEPIVKYVTYIGFNPHAHGETGVDNLDGNDPNGNDNNLTNETIPDGGVPLYDLDQYLNPVTYDSAGNPVFQTNFGQNHYVAQKGFFSYIRDLTGLDFVQLGLINVGDATGTLLAGLTGAITVGNQTGDGNNVSITVTAADGTVHTAEVDINNAYFKLLTNLIFDEESNLRLYEEQYLTYPTITVTKDANGNTLDEPYQVNVYKYVSEAGTKTIVPIVLTKYNNNGGTVEKGVNGQPYVTTTANDLIVAGRLELLHQAYIDAGEGVNTLEVDAKGYYAQPKALTNVQHIIVNNLPNVYNGASGDSTYPDLSGSSTYKNSVLDLTRAIDIETLTITESHFDGLGANQTTPGSLTVSGIRNGAETTIDGSFTQNVYLHFGEVQAAGVDLVLNNVNFGNSAQLVVAHNSPTLNIESTGGHNYIYNGNLGAVNNYASGDGALTTLNISGDAHLFIEGDLNPSFHNATPVTINAAANTGGVNLTLSGSQNVTFVGSQGNDRFSVQTAEYEGQPANDETVTIQGGVGNNYYEVIGADKVSITNADGNNNYEITRDGGTSTDLVTITAGNGANHFEIDRVSTAVLTVGNGNNQFDITSVNGYSYQVGDSVGSKSSITIVAGNGANDMDISADTNIGTVKVTAGNGGNAINIQAATINVTAGSGADDIRVEGRDITVDAGGSGNTITVVGIDDDYADHSALIKINAGTNSVVNLGSGNDPQSAADDDFPGTGEITAKVGSSITGTNITLVVDTVADLRAATLSGITKIVLDDDNATYANSSPSNTDTDKALLTLTDKQVAALVASGTTVEVEGGIFNTSAHIKIIVTQNLDVTTGTWATWLSSLPASVDLKFEINDGATLKLTAQQLHTKVASGGITIADDGNTDQVSGKVYITNAGLDFDPFNNNDQVRTVIDSRQYMGGSLSTDFVKDLNNNGIADEIANGVQRNEWGYNVLIDRVTYGYNRPADVPSYSRLTIDTDVQGSTIGPFSTIETFLRIVGEADMTFTPMKGGIDEWGAPIKGGTSIELGMDNGLPTNKFMVDFSEAGGTVSNLALGHFQMAQAIYGNGTTSAPARINVEIDDKNGQGNNQDAVASSTAGLVSRGVQTYVITKIEDGQTGGDNTVEFWTSRVTEDLETLGLRGNFGDTVIFGNTERGVDFLLEVAYDKFDGYAVGNLVANFARPEGATAVVNVVGLATLPANEVQKVASIVTDGNGLTINIEGGNTVIGAIGGANLDDVVLSTADNLAITTAVTLASLESIDASAVQGNLSLALTGTADGAGFEFTAAEGTTTLALNGVTAGAHSSFTAEDAATFNIVVNGSTNLSAATLENVDAISLGTVGVSGANSVTLSAAQALDIGLANIQLSHPGLTGSLNLANLGSQAFNAADLGAGVTLGSVSIAAGNVTLDPATVLTGATVTVAAGSTLTLTADQYMALGSLSTGSAMSATIHITGLTQAHIDAGFDLDGVNVNNGAGTISLAENVNLGALTDLNGFSVILADGQTLGVATVAQADGLKVEGGTNSTINLLFSTFAGSGVADIDVSGFNVDVLRFLDSLVTNTNVDDIFDGLLARVEKVIYNNYVSVIDQTVTISAGAVVNGNLGFDRTENGLELQNFVLNLQGGTRIANVDLGAAAPTGGLVQTYLKTVTINSTGTMANPVTGNTGNIMGSLTGGTGVTENDLLDVTVNASQGLTMAGVVFTNVGTTNEVATLTVTGDANVSIADLNTQDDDVDGLNVVNEGTGTLTVGINAANIDQTPGNTDALSFTGTGDIVLNVTGAVDLSDDNLSAVTKLVLANGANVTLTMAQADAIGAGDIVLAQGAAGAALNLEGLDGQPFAVANYGAGVTVNLMTLAADPVITLNAATNLTGINGLIVPEGTVLNMTAAQFQQLGIGNGVSGIITGVKADGTTATSNYTVNITDLTQADVAQGFDLSGITSTNITVTLAENVSLSTPSPTPANWDGINLFGGGASNGADINIGGFQLTLESVALADGLNITGTAGSVLKFTDTVAQAADQIDASGFDVSELHMTAQLIAGQNVDLLFEGLAASVTKVVTDDYGYVTGTSQTVVIEGGSTITGNLAFIKQEGGVEILDFTMNLDGGVNLTGNVNLSKDAPGALVPKHLQTVTINSTGTTANVLNGATANVITGSISAAALTDVDPITAGSQPTLENNLLNVTINASQALVVQGGVVFNSVTGDDAVTANDNDAAVANLTVNGTANVTIGSIVDPDTASSGSTVVVSGINTTDTDVDALNVVNNGTGTLNLVLSAANVNADDALSFTGTGAITLQVVGANLDLSDADLSAVTTITLGNKSATNGDLDLAGTITLAQDQLGTVTLVDGTDADAAATVHIVDFVGSVLFDATSVGVTVGTITMAPGVQTLAAGTDLTGVTSIIVPEGGTLSLTAAQFQQLAGTGTIVGLNTDGDNSDGNPFTLVITDLKQADVEKDDSAITGGSAGFSLDGVQSNAAVTITLGEASVTLGKIDGTTTTLASDLLVGTDTKTDVTFTLADGQTLGLVNYTQANGLNVNGGANSTIVFQYAPHTTYPGQIDASGYNVTTLKALAAGFTTGGNSNVEYSIDDLPSSVELRLYEDPADLGFLDSTFRRVVIEEGITTPTGLIFSDWDAKDEVRTLHLTLEGDVVLNGSLSIPTRTDKDGSLTQRYFDALTIVSEGTDTNTINGNINTATVLGGPNTSNNNLLNVTIEATQNLVITGAGGGLGNVVFSYNSASNLPPAAQVANFAIEGSANVTVDALDVSDGDIAALAVANNGTGVLTVTGASPAIFDNVAGPVGDAGANLETLTFSGTGDIVIGDANLVSSPWGISLANLSTIDASGLSGNLSLGEIKDIDSADFSFTAGTGVTTVTLSTDSLNSTGVDGIPGNTDDTAGWSFDFSNAAAGSEFHLVNLGALTAGSKLNIDMGANGTLYIDSSMDLSDLDLDITQVQSIVLADGATLTLTAAQANGLDIIAGPDTGGAGITAKVNIVDLTNDTDPDNPVDAFDLSGIAQNIAGTITFKTGVNDVTLDKATNLGFFSVTLDTLADETSSLTGQTIRFQNVAQAERVVIAAGDATPATGNSSNVVWLFDNITAPVDTRGYFSTGLLDPLNPYATAYTIGRLWLSEDLINNEGGDVEQLFTTLPHSILRVDFTDITALNVLLGSAAVNRVVELVHFTNLNDLTFSDVGLNPVEHLASLNLQLGGQVTIGNIHLNDVVGAPGYDPATVNFTALTIESRLAQHQDHYLAAEAYVNDNDGIDEVGEFARPNAINTIGDISVGAGLDLLVVNINTLDVAAGGVDANGGAAIDIGTITYGARTPAVPAVLTAELNVTGDNDITIASVVVTDADITGPVAVDLTGFTATLVAPGASPAFVLGDHIEALTFDNGGVAAGTVNLGSDDVGNPNAGVSGAGLSSIDASGFGGTLNLGILALIDGTNDDSTPLTPANDGLVPAFELTAGTGITTATLGKDPDSANVPTLAAGSEWIIDYTNAAADSRLTITDEVVFGTPALPGDPLPALTLLNVDLFIQGDVDLTGVDLSGSNNTSAIFVPAGNTLTISVDQALELAGLSIVITGEGTVKVVGNADDVVAATLGAMLQTVTVDLSGVTLTILDESDGTTDDDLLQFQNAGAVNDLGDPVAQNLIGSANNDLFLLSSGNHTVTGGAGDDTYTGGTGYYTYNVDAGTDTITELFSDTDGAGGDDGNDVLVVSAGATAEATVATEFVATAATVNNGTANLSTDADGATIDVSAAGGANGFNLTGGAGDDVLIGSDQVDVIVGGDGQDVLTGNGGADIFRFTTSTSTPLAMTVATTTPGEDWERVDITVGADADGGTITIPYSVNNGATTANLTVALAGSETPAQVAALVRAAFATAGFNAVLDGTDSVEVRGAFGSTLQLGTFDAGTSGVTGATGNATTNVDVAQVVTVTLEGANVVVGEVYSLDLALAGGSTLLEVNQTATTTLASDVATGLAALVSGLAAVAAVGAGPVVTITDTNADNGGFTVTESAIGGFNGSSASSNKADASTYDLIEDFGVGADKIDFQGLVAGSLANYREGGDNATLVTELTFAAALATAEAQINGTVRYFLTSIDAAATGSASEDAAAGKGVLFFDADGDGLVDGGVLLTGVTSANFAFGNIDASPAI